MNGSDPLSQLRDIHLPASGGFWPPAPGWWLLALLCLAALVAAALWWWRRRSRNRWRTDAEKALQALAQHPEASPDWFAQLNALLKRVARICHSSRHPESLSGDDWIRFLLATAPAGAASSQAVAEGLVRSAWQPEPEVDPAAALAFARSWLGGQKC